MNFNSFKLLKMLLTRQVLGILLLECLILHVRAQQISTSNAEENITIDVITTTEKIIDVQNKICSPEQSLHTLDDIRAIINYVFNKKAYEKILRDSYSSEAADVHHKHLLNVNEFREWIENRPTHLIHILKEMTIIRRRYVEPVVSKLTIDLQENPLLEEQFSHRLQKTQSLLKTLRNYEMICKYNCEKEHGHHLVKRNVQETREVDGYYCSSIEDLHKEIDSKLSKSIEDLKNQTKNIIANLDNKYCVEIEALKNTIKDEALNKFGRTMYGILELQDEYHHFREDFLQINVSEDTFSIKDLGMKIDSKLFNLEKSIKQYGHHCRHCNIQSVAINLLSAIEDEQNDKNYQGISVVDALIKIKLMETRRWVDEDLDRTFENLEDIIINTQDVDIYLQKLKQLKEEVTQLKDKEKSALNTLKDLLPQTSINKLFELVKESQELLKDIENNLQKLEITPLSQFY